MSYVGGETDIILYYGISIDFQTETLPKSEIIIDASTTLFNIPRSACNYKLGHQSALEWVLDYYRADQTNFLSVAGQYNTYHYSGNNAEVIDLLKRICTVSIETMKIIVNMLKQPVYPNY